MNDEDIRLRDLATEIKASSDRENKITKLQIKKLLIILLNSRQLNDRIAALNARWSGISDIRSIVAEAVNDRCSEVIKKIDNYDPQYSFINWVIGLLDNRVVDLLRKYRKLNDNISIESSSPSMLAKIEQKLLDANAEDKTKLEVMKIREIVEVDPHGYFAKTTMKSRPDVNLRAVSLLHFDGWKWREIADEFEITSVSTISSFFYREMQNLESYLRNQLRDE